MSFLTEPPLIRHSNYPMDEEQLEIATQFVELLISIGTVRPPPGGINPVKNTCLFCVPMPGQPGEWRVIADC